MIHFELMCGGCDSTYQVDCDSDVYEDTAWLMAQRFMNAHAKTCNFATPLSEEQVTKPDADDEPKQRVIKTRRTDEDEPS